MKKIVFYFFMSLLLTGNVTAKTTFLPDWGETDLEVNRGETDYNIDGARCESAVDRYGNKLYHKASGCSAPKIFDEYCPFDDEYISKCYCPAIFSKTCEGNYRGDTRVKDTKTGFANCDDLWVACCDGSCPAGTSKTDPGGCGGMTINACGDTCYYPYVRCCTPLSSETGCAYGTETCSDGCGGTRTCCKACKPLASDTNCRYGTKNCGDDCGGTRTCCKTCSDNGGNETCSGESSASSCPYGVQSTCKDCMGTTKYICKTCADNGGSNTCSGETTPCDTNSQIQVSSCTDCSGQTLYECKKKLRDTCGGVTDCVVGTIYYTDGTCCAELLSKPVGGVVVKDYELIMSTDNLIKDWGEHGYDVVSLDNIIDTTMALNDYKGKNNTALIVSAFNVSSIVDTAKTSAVLYCSEYAPIGMEDTKGQWWLPAVGELYDYVYGNYSDLYNAYVRELGWDYLNTFFSSSTEYDGEKAWIVHSNNGTIRSNFKANSHKFGCFYSLK